MISWARLTLGSTMPAGRARAQVCARSCASASPPGALTRTHSCGPARLAPSKRGNPRARGRALRRVDGVLEVQDQGVGGAGERLGLLALAVPGDKEPRAQRRSRAGRAHAGGRFIMRALRRQEATSSSR